MGSSGRFGSRHTGRWLAAPVALVLALAAVISFGFGVVHTSAATAQAGQTIPLSTSIGFVEQNFTVDGTAQCEGMTVLLVSIPANVITWTASVRDTTSNYNYPAFISGEQSNPVTYGDLSYPVPPGDAGYFLAAGGGPIASGPCTQNQSYSVTATGFTGNVLSGQIKDKCGNPVSGVAVDAQTNLGKHLTPATTDSNGAYSFAVSPGDETVSPQPTPDFTPLSPYVTGTSFGNATQNFTKLGPCDKLTMTVSNPQDVGGNAPAVGDDVPVTVTVTASGKNPETVNSIGFTGQPLSWDPSTALTSTNNVDPSSFSLAPGASQQFTFDVNVASPPTNTELDSAVSGTGSDGAVDASADDEVQPCPGAPYSTADALMRPLTIGEDSWPRATTSSKCNLTVTIKPLTQAKAGLSNDFGLGASFIGSDGDCVSGCRDVLVTVKNSAGKPVPNATVNASVTGISDDTPYPSGAKPSPGYLCDAAQPTNCGSGNYLTGLSTNSSGQVKLLYWEPGVTKDHTATITAKASADTNSCSNSGCPLQKESGTGNKAVTVKVNQIYLAHMDISEDLGKELAELDERPKSFTAFFADLAKEEASEKLVEKAADWLIEEGEKAEEVGDTVNFSVKAIKQLLKDNHEQRLLSLFLCGLRLAPTGLGVSDTDASSVRFVPGRLFNDAMLDQDSGIIYRIGHGSQQLEDRGELGPQNVHLTVYEVSYCKQGQVCGPGYHGQPGIAPYLDFEFTAGTHTATTLPYTQFVVPYNAKAWMLVQFAK